MGVIVLFDLVRRIKKTRECLGQNFLGLQMRDGFSLVLIAEPNGSFAHLTVQSGHVHILDLVIYLNGSNLVVKTDVVALTFLFIIK